MSCSRPFRVWNSTRQIRKSLMATSLFELKQKAKTKFGLDENIEVRVVLEADGTRVEDEEYFNFLSDDSTLILLTEDESWCPLYTRDKDETDAPINVSDIHGNNCINSLVKLLRQDLAKIVLFSSEQLQVIVDTEESHLGQLLCCSATDTRSIQTACQRYLDERQQATDTQQLIKLLKNKFETIESSSSSKRKKTSGEF